MSDTAFARHFIGRLHAAVNAHDVNALVELCCDDVVWQDPAAPHTLRGRDDVRWFHQHVMFAALPDVQIELIDGPFISSDGSGLAVRLRIEGTMSGTLDPPGFAPTRGRLRFETAEFSRLRGGLLAEHVVVLDMLNLARQIGAMPAADSVAGRVGVWLQHAAALCSRLRGL
jgi:predicted ester cyclase